MKAVADFIFELGQLKREKRSGWWRANIKDPESVAEHSHRAAIVAYVLAKLENADAEKAATMCVLHDLPETRVGDASKIAQRYFSIDEAKVVKEQVASLPKDIADSITMLMDDYHNQKSKESIIARDADLLEAAFQAKEYIEQGYASCQDWINNVKKLLTTKSAKELLSQMEKSNSTEWWQGLKNIKR
jgi:putative hydrolase of HD superfamily